MIAFCSTFPHRRQWNCPNLTKKYQQICNTFCFSYFQSLGITPNDRHKFIPGSPAPHTMTQSSMDHAPRLGRKSMPQSPQISISPVDEDADRSGLIGSRVLDTVVEVKGVGVAVSHPIIELSNNGNKRSGKGKCQKFISRKFEETWRF